MQAPSEFQLDAAGYQMRAVATVSYIRRANLLLLIAKLGSIQALATRIERSHSQLSQLKNQSKRADGRPRIIGDDLARHIERMLELEPGWMDQPQLGASSAGTMIWARPDGQGGFSSRQTIAEKVADLQAEQVTSQAAASGRRHEELRRLVDVIATDPQLAAEASGFLAALAMRVRLGELPPATGTNGH